MRQIVSGPLYFSQRRTREGELRRDGVGGISRPNGPDLARRHQHEFLSPFLRDLGPWLSSLRDQRAELAVAHLFRQVGRKRPEQPADPVQSTFLTVRDVIREVFQVDQVTLYGRRPGSGRLVPVVTTGLVDIGGKLMDANDPNSGYHIQEMRDTSFTAWLGAHPGAVVRKNDIPDPNEKGMPAGFPSKPMNKECEAQVVMVTEHCRFLGASVACGNAAEAGGVIRINRTEASRPFRKSDERMLARIARALVQVFEVWQNAPAPGRSGWGHARNSTAREPVYPLTQRTREQVIEILCRLRAHFQKRRQEERNRGLFLRVSPRLSGRSSFTRVAAAKRAVFLVRLVGWTRSSTAKPSIGCRKGAALTSPWMPLPRGVCRTPRGVGGGLCAGPGCGSIPASWKASWCIRGQGRKLLGDAPGHEGTVRIPPND